MGTEEKPPRDILPAHNDCAASTCTLSAALYKELVESSQDLIWQCDVEGRYIFLNRAWEKSLGYQVKEMLGRRLTDFVSTERAEQDASTFSMLLCEGSLRDYETPLLHRDGHEVWLSFNATTVKNSDGQILGTSGLAYDISARKLAETELKESRQRYREMVLRSPMGMHFYDLIDDRLVFSDFNPAADRLLGVSNAQFVGKTIEDAFPPLAATEIPMRYRAAAADGTPWSTEQVVYHDEQIEGAFEVYAFQISHNKMVAVFLEITDRKRAEEALKNEKERVTVTLGSIGDGVIATDVSGHITLMNKVAENMTGWTIQEAAGRPLKAVFNIINESTRVPSQNPVERVLRTLSIVEIENHTVLIAKDGTERLIADSGAPIFDSKCKIIGVVLVFRDVTEKTKLNETVRRAQKLESLGVLAGGIAHDFNNLLGGIFGYIDLARDMSQDPNIRDYLEKAFFTMDRARALTDQLLTFSKGGRPILKTLDPSPIIARAAKFMLTGTDVSLTCDFAPDLKRCRIDENQFGQVIDNIVINAKQAMPQGGRISIKAENVILTEGDHRVPSPGEYVRISFKDTGCGIPKEILPNIFDPFFTTKQMGSGLGLSTCYSIIQQHGGAVDAESLPGVGSTFILYLPAIAGDEDVPATGTAVVLPTPKGRILIMDDEDYIREVLGDMLLSLGFQVKAVDCGERAVEAMREETVDDRYIAAILDLTVPGKMGGKKASERLLEIRPDLPIFLSSGYSDDPVIATPASFGFSGSFIKPYRKQHLAATLLEFFSTHPSK
jgi:PAS domain S-box-containing protein